MTAATYPSAETDFDAIILGAGAAGLFCSAQAGQLGLKVLLIDHAEKVAEKIRPSDRLYKMEKVELEQQFT